MNTHTLPENDTLYRLWHRSRHTTGRAAPPAPTQAEWNEEIRLVEQYGKGMEETMRYLYMEQPAYEAFVQWVCPAGSEEAQEERLEEDVLSAEDLAFWQQNGYVVVRNAVTAQQAADAAEAIWNHLKASPSDPATWYRPHEDLRGLMLTFYHHPALAANRSSPRIRRAYEQVYGTTGIYRNMDKVSFNPPEKYGHRFMGSPLHWDVSLQLPIPLRLQGLLYLTDTDAHNGAFHCVPGFHNTIGDWLGSLPPGTNPRDEALTALQPIPVTGNAGDFIIWHQALPHCATANHGTAPRLVQYFTYLRPDIPAQEEWI